ncbi:hypothetical protein LBMAG52_00100 [Planctomycetia bacterium]|nr:hypothetical protein LBMAG52_00100 [Planctomycetia bacterium]
MALKLTVESFLQVVRQSGLIDSDQLQKLLQEYEARGVDVKQAQSIADALIGGEVITRWQAEKLLAGKHKGFSLGKYKLLDLLGKGGMSSVYLAEHVLMKRRCAIKVLPGKRVNDSSYLARFHREAQAVASVDHPNIVRAYDVDCTQDRDSQIHFLVMEYVQGQSLQELIIGNGPADYADAVEYIRQAAEGLEHAHRAGLVHRDIKPANLLIDTSGVIKLLDMGLARFFDDRDENPLTVTHDEKVLGTADYLAPEQALDSHTVDARADIYSLGCSLQFLLTGNPPYTEGTLTQRLMWHQTKPFPPLTDSRIDCPVSLSAVLNKMVEKKPEDRYQSAAEVAEVCRQWLADNAGTDWKQRHVPLSRGNASSGRLASPTRDLQSAPAILKPTSHVMDSALLPQDADSSLATKISLPETVLISPAPVPPVGPVVAPTVAAVLPVAPPIAVPVVVAVAVPLVAVPVAQPVGNPLPPAAKPIVPIAAPVVATPIAQPVVVAAPVVTPAEPVTALFDFFQDATAEATAVTPDFQFGSEAVSEATVIIPVEVPAEFAEDDNLFSLFGSQNEDPPAAEAETTLDLPVEPTPAESSLAETVVVESSQPPSEAVELSFETSGSEPPKPTPKKSTISVGDLLKKPVARYGMLAAAAVMVIGGLAWWSIRGSDEFDKAVTKSTKKGKSGKSLANNTSGGAKKSDAYEVTLIVGPGGDFKSIGRAVHSAVESRAEHEKAANGKPLRFLIQVKPGQTFEEAIMLDESFPGEVHLTSDTPGKNVTLTSPSLSDPAITIKNRSDVTIENIHIDLSGFPQKEKGIVITGSVERCRIRNCVVSDAGKSGIELSGAVGGEGSDGIVLEGITFQKASPTSAGVHVSKSSTGTPTQRVTVQRCRFFGSMSSGVLLEGPVESLTIRNCGATGSTSGIRFAGGVVAKKILIDHCSFRNQIDAGLLFDAMPGEGTGDLVWRNCLFAGAAKAELLIAKDYDANKFHSLMSADKPVENNWSDRKIVMPVNGERDVLGNGGSRISAIQFEATAATAELFLVAKAGESYKTAGIKAK